MYEMSLGKDVGTIILPILTICSLTSEFCDKDETRKPLNIELPRLESMSGIPTTENSNLRRLIDDCQDSFEKEVGILMNNDLPLTLVEDLFKRYKEFFWEKYKLMNNLIDTPRLPEHLTFDDHWILDDSLSLENLNDIPMLQPYQLSDFEITQAEITTTSDILGEPLTIELSGSQLSEQNTPIFSQNFGIYDYLNSITNEIESSTTDSGHNRRHRPSKDVKEKLEQIFTKVKNPNSVEREYIAKKCNMTPTQVRIWFTNKRARQIKTRDT